MTLSSRDGALLESVRAIRWHARWRAAGAVHGAHISRMRGFSQEFTEYRAYRQGDETRRIDWKLLARTDRAFVRLSSERTLLPTMLLVDASGSLAFPAKTLRKWFFARELALGLAAIVQATGDPIGLLCCADARRGIVHLPPRTRRSAVHEIAQALSDVTPAGSEDVAVHLGRLRDFARIAIVSDFLGPQARLLAVAGELSARGKEIHAVHVIDEHELAPPANMAVLVDPERSDVRRRMTDMNRAQYLRNFAAWRKALSRDWRLRGAWFTQTVSTEPAAHAIRRVVADRSEGYAGS